MMPNSLQKHALFQHKLIGSDQWWELVSTHGTPLIQRHETSLACVFLWKKNSKNEHIYIDVYSQTPSIYKQWNQLQQFENTNVYFFEITLPLDWSGSYTMISTQESAPESVDSQHRKQWWMNQLKLNAQKDPFNRFDAYPSLIAKWINQIHSSEKISEIYSVLIAQHSEEKSTVSRLNWNSECMQHSYLVDLFSTGTNTQNAQQLPLVLCLDGQLWSQHLSIVPELKCFTEKGMLQPAHYAFLHSRDISQRINDYGCNDLFSHALVNELIPEIQKKMAFSKNNVLICGQSLGALCAIHCSLRYPHIFKRCIAQSASYWWSDFQNSTSLSQPARHKQFNSQKFDKFSQSSIQNFAQYLIEDATLTSDQQFFISAGMAETDMREDALNVFHALKAKPYHKPNQIHGQLFSGGHDAVNWRTDFLSTLKHILSNNSDAQF